MIQPSKRVEIAYRFTAPLPLQVEVNGVRWEFAQSEVDWPPYFSLILQKVGKPEHYVVMTFSSREEARIKSMEPIRFDYPHVWVPIFKRLRLEGRAELVAGPHTQLYYMGR